MDKLCFDIGANRGDFTIEALKQGYKVIALEPAPKVFSKLVQNFIYNPNVVPLKFAVSQSDYARIEFYEADEDGLSTINEDWLTADGMPYQGKPYRVTSANTITIDKLAEIYGTPDLIKIDVEGAEWNVFKGLSRKMGMVTFEWTDVTIPDHELQLQYLLHGGYTQVSPQFIESHCKVPDKWFALEGFSLAEWVARNADLWTGGYWKASGLRPTADVGMVWVR